MTCPTCGRGGADFPAFTSEGHVGEVPVYRLTADKQVVQCLPSEVGDWRQTGRRPVAYSTLYLPGRVQVWQQTRFLPVDYWPESPVPLLFESTLSHMHRNKMFDVFTRRYGSYAEAQLGHMSIFEPLLSKVGDGCLIQSRSIGALKDVWPA